MLSLVCTEHEMEEGALRAIKRDVKTGSPKITCKWARFCRPCALIPCFLNVLR